MAGYCNVIFLCVPQCDFDCKSAGVDCESAGILFFDIIVLGMLLEYCALGNLLPVICYVQ